MKIERLIEMANDIANFFRTEPNHADAVKGVANHICKFWDPRMREQILEYLDTDSDEFDPIVKDALEKLKITNSKTTIA